MINNGVLRKNPDIVTRVIEDETILVPIYRTSKQMDCIYTLNETASEFWKLIDGKRTLDEIKKAILRKFDVTLQEADKELSKLLKDLLDIKAVVK